MKNNTNNTKSGFKAEMPDGWVVMELIEIANGKISNGVFNDPKKVGTGYRLINVLDLYNEPNIDTSLLSKLNLDSKEFARNVVKWGDIFFTRSSLKLEGIAYCNINLDKSEDITYDGHIMKVSPNQEIAYPPFVRLYCISHLARQFFMSRAKQNTMTTIGQDDISDMPIPLPPLPEQKAIAHILGLMDTAIHANNQIIVQKELRKKWLMQKLLTGKMRLKGFGGEWKKLGAGEIFKSVTLKGFESEELLSATQDRGIIPRTMLEGRVTMPEGTTAGYKLVEPGDFVISLRSFQGGLEYSYYRGIVSPAYIVLKPKKKINEEFYKQYYKSHEFIGRLATAVIGIRDGKQVSYDDYCIVKIPYPSLDEQTAIAQVLQAADKELEILRKKGELLRAQKKGMMQVLLTGKKRLKI